jgi:malonyl-CoA/methylmalonyl-CoA synthetase
MGSVAALTPAPFEYLRNGHSRVALIDGRARYTYSELNERINKLACGLLNGKKDLEEERIAFLMPAGLDYVTMLFGTWRAGGISVPLNVNAAMPELEHALTCARVRRLVAAEEYHNKLAGLCSAHGIELLSKEQLLSGSHCPMPQVAPDRRAMILFTSGTTSKPKGVVTTHGNIHAQIASLIEAWAWEQADSIPLFLPLHHIHGIINVLCCALWAGASVSAFPKFNMDAILGGVAAGSYSVFMAVPTIYIKLIQHIESLDKARRQAVCDGFRAMRLNVSGSAACPVKVYDQWLALTGQMLLERYGMTETGMTLSNPYRGERRAGAVGVALPGVEAGLYNENDQIISADGVAGEIRIRGDNVFLEYWDNPAATAAAFRHGWFCTGDIAVIENGYYRILGRASVDIIKSGGYKLSALEIEGALLTHEDIAECAVAGIEDETWGEAVTAFVVLKPGKAMEYDQLKDWCTDKMSAYKIPKQLVVLDTLPRNAMGKVTKPALKLLLPAK